MVEVHQPESVVVEHIAKRFPEWCARFKAAIKLDNGL